MKVLSGTGNTKLAEQIANELGVELVLPEFKIFANGEQRIWIPKKLSGQQVVLVQSLSAPVDTHIIQLLLLIDALERLGVKQLFLVVPWMGYSLQDKVFREGEPIAAKVVAQLLSSRNISRTFLLDLHNSAIAGFFEGPNTHLSTLDLFVDFAKRQDYSTNTVVVCPDIGGLRRAQNFADKLNLPMASMEKQRNLVTGEVTTGRIHGEVSGMNCLVYDDVIMSGSTLVKTAQALKSNGAKKVVCLATHGIFTKSVESLFADAAIDEIIITDSVEQNKKHEKITVLNIAKLLAEPISEYL